MRSFTPPYEIHESREGKNLVQLLARHLAITTTAEEYLNLFLKFDLERPKIRSSAILKEIKTKIFFWTCCRIQEPNEKSKNKMNYKWNIKFCELFLIREIYWTFIISIGILLVPAGKNICVFLSPATLPPPSFECLRFYCVPYCYELDFVWTQIGNCFVGSRRGMKTMKVSVQ